jgi:hypothetical protein
MPNDARRTVEPKAARPSIVRANPRDISDTLKEAVADALLNTTVSRLSGRGQYGEVLYGVRPRLTLASGFLLPRQLPTDEDEVSASISISAHGADFLVAANADGTIRVKPYAAVYLRVFPTAAEMLGHPSCELKFHLQHDIELELKRRIRQRSNEALATLSGRRKNPAWGGLEKSILKEVHNEMGIPFSPETVDRVLESDTDNPKASAPSVDAAAPPAAAEPDGETVIETTATVVSGRTGFPDHLAREEAVPEKWVRLDLKLPAFVFSTLDAESLAERATRALNDAIAEQLNAWTENDHPTTGGKLWGYRRVRKIRPSDVQAWDRFLAEARGSKLAVVLPDIALEWDVRVEPDFLSQESKSIHIALENRSELNISSEVEQAAFQVTLDIEVPTTLHRQLLLDRVKPSYRYWEYLQYPALGYNGGVEASSSGDLVRLRTTWSPKYCLPRLIPVSLESEGVVANIESLSKPDCLPGLKPIVSCFEDWLQELKSFPFAAGIDATRTDLIAREEAKFIEDQGCWAAEIASINTGIALLEESATYWKGPGVASDPRAAPFEAWLAMNAAMARVANAKGYSDWRLFQLTFILANLPVLVTRMPEFRKYYTEDVKRAADAVTLLYFATGGGKSEAFLGLLVFALFFDRLRGKERGVTAMLRYPLRLLTLQQAQRTAKTLAQAEFVRRERGHPGEPFSIGFWVGSSNTPNSLTDDDVKSMPDVSEYPARRELTLRDRNYYIRALERWNKLPECPFCSNAEGTGLRRFPALGGMLGHLCLNAACDWNRWHEKPTPLPFLIVDEDIYELPPSVLLGTVDKLALLGQAQRTIRRFLGMFGFAPGYQPDTKRLYTIDPRHRELLSKPSVERPFAALFPTYADGEKRFFDPFPSLLIQDEAHLLDESLGTFAGLFETAMESAVDQLAPLLGDQTATEPETGRRRRVKVIAASATVSDPQRQMQTIYQRCDTIQFPHPGPELYRSFYAVPKAPGAGEAERLEVPERDAEGRNHWARVYRSILTNGHAHTMTVVETLAQFHTSLTTLYELVRSNDAEQLVKARALLQAELSPGPLRPLLDRALATANSSELATLLDLHRIALTYVTNKKGGDQIMAAEASEFDKKHRAAGLMGYHLEADLITGAVDAGHIQAVVNRAESRPKPGEPLPGLNGVLRSIVATSAVSHGVDVEELNSMFFAGMPSDIAEYIQASSRVGRTHVGFCVLIPTPQRARDRYIVEVHDIFHRFLERMIAPAAVDRWAERAVARVISSFFQTYLCGVRAVQALSEATDAEKQREPLFRETKDVRDRESLSFKREIEGFIGEAVGLRSPFAPVDDALVHYKSLIHNQIADIFSDMGLPLFDGSELRNFLTRRNLELRPMMSLRDVDKPGRIVPTGRDLRDNHKVDADTMTRVLRLMRGGSGTTDDEDDE